MSTADSLKSRSDIWTASTLFILPSSLEEFATVCSASAPPRNDRRRASGALDGELATVTSRAREIRHAYDGSLVSVNAKLEVKVGDVHGRRAVAEKPHSRGVFHQEQVEATRLGQSFQVPRFGRPRHVCPRPQRCVRPSLSKFNFHDNLHSFLRVFAGRTLAGWRKAVNKRTAPFELNDQSRRGVWASSFLRRLFQRGE